MASAAVVLAALATFAISLAQARINARHGTDHAVHRFIIRQIRANGFRFFVRIPRLLNEAYIGALPLYLHWVFAHFPLRVLRYAERLLNPAVNALHTLLVGGLAALAARELGLGWSYVALAGALFALTPQFYHALSARNFGLSARSLGLILLTAAFYAAYAVAIRPDDAAAWALLIGSCYLVWAFSTFGAQALVLCSLVLWPISGNAFALAGALGGLAVFIAVHPRYSLGYLGNTFRFIRAYARELAPVYVLARRHSIWRDLVWDIWKRIAAAPIAGLRYAYENSALIVFLLNPLWLVAALAWFVADLPQDSLARYACATALSGGLVALATSFRATRFLGEPERYVEATAAWGALGGLAALMAVAPAWLPLVLVAAYLAVSLAELGFSTILSRYLAAKPIRLDQVERAVEDAGLPSVRCCSNNEQYLKLLLANDWDFSYCIAAGHGYCGFTMAEAFDPFPLLRREALARMIEAYRITVCVLDKARFDEPFASPPAALSGQRVIFESEGLKVYAFSWSAENPAEHAVREAGSAARAGV